MTRDHPGMVIGGIQASSGGWRPLFWIVCGIGVLAFLLSLLTFEDSPPQDPQAPRDWAAIVLAETGCAAAFSAPPSSRPTACST